MNEKQKKFSSNYFMKLINIMLKMLIIADKIAALKILLNFVHIDRQAMDIIFTWKHLR